ncbi:MAG TPA: alpha-2-macroglobulin, partial [Myxococcaceae bacterium]|nr:alpha-2-macroglobulin [Myxococcaceae bacterium]
FKAVRGADKDGVEQKIPLELPVAVETVATYGDTEGSRVEGLSVPKDVRPEVGGLQLTMASTALGHFEEGMRQLVDYPYGCLEQQSSRLVPFVALREIASKFGVAWKAPDAKKQAEQADLNAFFREYLFDPLDVSHEVDPDKVVRATVESIERLQDADGSFRYWADAQCSDSWSSAYATLALHRAADVGYPVNSEVLNHADAYLDKVAGGTCRPCEGGCPDETRVMALYSLARGRTPKPSYYEQLFKKRQGLPLFSQALLADAMFVGGGDRGHAKQLLQEILNHAKVAPEGVHFEETHGATYATLWHSDTRTSGAVLETLTDIQPDHPFVGQIAHYLEAVRRGDGQLRSTQEAAFSLMGLAEVVRTKEKDTPAFTARATLGKKTLMEELFKGRSLAVKEKSVPISELGADAKLTLSKEGAGVLYYSAALRYAPKDLPLRSLDHGLIVQRWFEPYAGGGQATRFNAGDLVRIRLRVGTNQERHWAAFEVPLPAGLEAVDTSLATTARLGQSPEEESREAGYEYESGEEQAPGSAEGLEGEGEARRWAYHFWSPFEHVEQRDSKIVVFADHLPPGVHTTSFVARATTPGTFLVKPAAGQLMYEPEVFGRSEGGSFEVISPAEVSAR